MNLMNLLPIGSVVMLNNSNNLILIIGIRKKVKLESGEEAIFDYIACPYPYGIMDFESTILFNHTDIKNIVFEGYRNDDLKEFYEDLEWDKNENK